MEILGLNVGWHNVESISTRWLMDGPGIEPRWRRLTAHIQTDPRAHLAYCKMGTGSLSPGVKLPERGFPHSPSSNTGG